jgi:hypothetical protein
MPGRTRGGHTWLWLRGRIGHLDDSFSRLFALEFLEQHDTLDSPGQVIRHCLRLPVAIQLPGKVTGIEYNKE